MQASIDFFINSIRRRRKQCGLSLKELASQSGVSLEILEELEQGSLPDEMMVTDALNLADVFQCKVYELFE